MLDVVDIKLYLALNIYQESLKSFWILKLPAGFILWALLWRQRGGNFWKVYRKNEA